RPLNVLVGANGSGKTSLLEVFSLLAASADGRLNAKLRDLGGFSSVVTQGQTKPLEIGVDWRADDGETCRYEIARSVSGVGYRVHFEKLGKLKPDGALSGFAEFPSVGVTDPTELVLGGTQPNQQESQLSQVLVPATFAGVPRLERTWALIHAFRNALLSCSRYASPDVGLSSPIRLPQQLRPADLPGENGEDLIACLYGMREVAPDAYASLEDSLRAAFPGFVRLEFPSVAAGMLAMLWRDERFAQPLYMNQLSEGTLRFLWLSALLHSPRLPKLVLIDEPEVSLHPELLRLLAELMRAAADRSQLIVATHSDRLVRFLDPGEVAAMDLDEEGMVTAQRADELDLEEWLNEYSLDELWQMGRA
ncbi:MAG: AAA family ATPase, partial [Planctomycetota bacterium]